MLTDVEVPILIVGFKNTADIVKCLSAVGEQRGCPKFGVFICENGGADAFDFAHRRNIEARRALRGRRRNAGLGRAQFRARAPAETRRRASSDLCC